MFDETEVRYRLAQEVKRGTFLGGPAERFFDAGKMQLDLLKAMGLKPHHRVVDIGSGPLRAGIWLMDYLEVGHYYSLEPSADLISAGRRIAGPELLDRAKPTYDDNDSFDLSVFGARFDFGVARSIWTHASMEQISLLLESWSAGQHGVLFASFLPTVFRPYRGKRWIGISHDSGEPGLVRHRRREIRNLARQLGLKLEPVDGWGMGTQRWLKISPVELA